MFYPVASNILFGKKEDYFMIACIDNYGRFEYLPAHELYTEAYKVSDWPKGQQPTCC